MAKKAASAENPPAGPPAQPTEAPKPAESAAAPSTPSAPAPAEPQAQAAAENPPPQPQAAAPTDPAAPATTTADATAAAQLAPSGADAPPTGDDASLEQLLKEANFEDANTVAPDLAADAEAFKLPTFQQALAEAQVSSIELLRDVELNVKIELGRNRMLVEDVLKLTEGSVVELDKLAGDPVDVFVNDRLVARGEVLVLNDNFCVRVNEIVAGVKEEAV
jgi:flagellar motor switch protein FliN/FliY